MKTSQPWLDAVSFQVDAAIHTIRSGTAPDDALGAAEAALEHALRTGPDLAIVRLARTVELSTEELLAVWCLIAGQLDPRIAARLEGLSGGPEITLGALAAIAYRSQPARAIEELGLEGRLFRLALLESADDPRGATPSWSRRTVRVTDRALALALASEIHTLDSRLAGIARIEIAVRPVAELAIDPDALAKTQRALADGTTSVIVAGKPGLGRRSLLMSVARERGIEVLTIEASRLAREPAVARIQLRQLARECCLLHRAPLLIGLETMSPEVLELVRSELVRPLKRILATTGTVHPALRWDRPAVVVDLPAASADLRAALWLRTLGHADAEDGEYLATRYPLAPAIICRAVAAARMYGDELSGDVIRSGIRTVLDDRLGQLATRVTVTQTWDDLVLPVDQLETIVELRARIRERKRVYEDWGFAAKLGKGLGLSALMSGPPGTGKTMVAALIARDLGLELYQVDVAKIVSKWVGETEKQLGELFDAAEAGHAVLLFDEADTLFGKRTEVKSSNDRYANQETNYLLQRLETFTGICLLTTNHEGNMDPAFKRRLSFQLRFAIPEAAEREALWKAILPAEAPVEGDLDLRSLADRYVMSGGYIRNAVLRAAFLAANRKSPITAPYLAHAARLEYEAMGKLA